MVGLRPFDGLRCALNAGRDALAPSNDSSGMLPDALQISRSFKAGARASADLVVEDNLCRRLYATDSALLVIDVGLNYVLDQSRHVGKEIIASDRLDLIDADPIGLPVRPNGS
ncbi:MAG: hypothetical protein QOH41_4528 [Blastocatellia bacterium]|nr:hypothetical protein [Blastocatellia bacterium]